MGPRIRPVWRGARLCAPAFTVRCAPGDNLAVHVAVTRAPAGSALVVSVGGEEERGYWGEVLTTAAQARGLAGLVIEGGVRDLAALEAHGFPVFATTIALRGASKTLGGEVGGTIAVGGVTLRTADWIVADADGVAVIGEGELDEVLSASRTRVRREGELFAQLQGGRTTLELLGLDASEVRNPLEPPTQPPPGKR